MVGRGLEVKIYVADVPLFEKLENERATLEKRANDIDLMFSELDKIVSKAGDIKLSSPTPYGLHSGTFKHRKRIADIKRHLAEVASKKLGIDTAAAPTATPSNLPEVMKSGIANANAEIAKLESEIKTLDALHKECQQIMIKNQHLLEPAEEPQPVIEKTPPPMPFAGNPEVLAYRDEEQAIAITLDRLNYEPQPLSYIHQPMMLIHQRSFLSLETKSISYEGSGIYEQKRRGGQNQRHR